jgi:hypothetical protein
MDLGAGLALPGETRHAEAQVVKQVADIVADRLKTLR